ncbi:hypothetical protein Bbelb_300670 [Branchiostoma belcheri]|nr:hypothetical protein Bbelb_300670 [Branchiostoma belcheri]
MASGTSPRSRKGRHRRQEFPSSATLGSFWDHHPAVNLQSVEDILDRKLREGQDGNEDDAAPRSWRDRRYEVSSDQLGSFVDHRSGFNFRSVDDVTTQGVSDGPTGADNTPRVWSSQDRSQETPSYSTLGSRPSPVDLQSVENIISQRYRGEEDASKSSARPSRSQERSQDSPSYSTLGSRPSPVDLQSLEDIMSAEDASRLRSAWLQMSQERSQDSPSYSTLGSRPSPVDLSSVNNLLRHRYGVSISQSDLPLTSRSSSKTSLSHQEETPSSSTLGSTPRRRSVINLRSIEDVIRRKFRSFRHRSASSGGPLDGPNSGAPVHVSQPSSSQTLSMSLHPSNVTFGTATEAGLSNFSFNTNVWNVASDMTTGGIRASSRSGPQGYSTMPPSGYFPNNRPAAVAASQSSHAGSAYASASSASSDVSMDTSVPMETPSATSLRELHGWEDEVSDEDTDSSLDSEPQSDDPAQFKYCYRCDGLGITHSDDTWHWAPSRELPCHFCRRCTTCKGNGVIPITSNICHRCEGKGFFHGSPAAHTQTGRVRCLLCEDCGACEGKGVMPVGRALCAQCRGRGAVHAGAWAEVPHRARRTQRCFFCTPCDWCSGKGTIQTGYTL